MAATPSMMPMTGGTSMKRYLKSLVFWLLAAVTVAWFASLVLQPTTNDFHDLGLLLLLLLYPFQLLFFLLPVFIGLIAVLNWARGRK